MDAQIKIFTFKKDNATVEWFKSKHEDCFFDEKHVRYNDRSLFETLLGLYVQWEVEGRTNVRAEYPCSLIMEEIGFVTFLYERFPSLKIDNETEGLRNY